MDHDAPAYLRRLLAPAVPDAGPTLSATPPEGRPPQDVPPPRVELVEIPHRMPAAELDPDAVRIVGRLAESGFQAYLVGGCVRDLLFGLRPKDFDVATSATPRDIRRLFRNCRIIGRRFRLAHVFFRDKIIEVATFRAAGPQNGDENGELLIRDDNVFGTAEQDAVRRDFTFNALFYDYDRQLILDYVGGVADIERREVRTIGDPHIRLREDPIRILRAIRLAARMGCAIEPATWRAIEMHREDVLRAAAPRIIEDVLRMFRGGAVAPAMDLLMASGVLQVILPELHQHLAQSAAGGRVEEVEALRAVLRVVDVRTRSGRPLSVAAQLALLLAPTLMSQSPGVERPGPPAPGADKAVEAMRPIALRLSISRKDGDRVRHLLATLDKLPPRPGRKRRSAASLMRRAYFPDALDVFEVMALATGDLVDEAGRWRRRLADEVPEGLHAPAPPARRPRRERRRRPRGARRHDASGPAPK